MRLNGAHEPMILLLAPDSDVQSVKKEKHGMNEAPEGNLRHVIVLHELDHNCPGNYTLIPTLAF